jgi:hypothetical protein
MEIGKSFFGKNHGKLSHWRNLSPKTIYEESPHIQCDVVTLAQLCQCLSNLWILVESISMALSSP